MPWSNELCTQVMIRCGNEHSTNTYQGQKINLGLKSHQIFRNDKIFMLDEMTQWNALIFFKYFWSTKAYLEFFILGYFIDFTLMNALGCQFLHSKNMASSINLSFVKSAMWICYGELEMDMTWMTYKILELRTSLELKNSKLIRHMISEGGMNFS